MKITIAYLYYDLLNFYGDSGNIKILSQYLNKQNIDVDIKYLSLEDELNFSDYDFIYIGMGINENLLVAKNHLIKYKDEIKEAIENNKFFLCTGNSYELFGKTINNEEALGIFDYETEYLGINNPIEVDSKCDLIDTNIIGFINRLSKNNNKANYFLVDMEEGILYKNFIGTYTLGPILVRNPRLLEYLAHKIISSKDEEYQFENINLDIYEDAYNDCIERRKKNNQA